MKTPQRKEALKAIKNNIAVTETKTTTKSETEKGLPPTKIISCTCQHEFQDKTYGKGKRVMNLQGKNGKPTGATPKYRCTVCDKGHDH